MQVTTQRSLTDILRDFDPKDTVTEAIVFLGNVSGFSGCYEYKEGETNEGFDAFAQRKMKKLEAYIDAHITDAPIEDEEMRDIIHAWVYAQRVLISEGIDRIVKAAAERNEKMASVETAEIETSAQSDKQPKP